MPKTAKLLNEMATYLSEEDFDWFKDNFELKNPELFFTFENNILTIRNKKTGVITHKFKVETLETIDDDLAPEDEEEIDAGLTSDQISNITAAANNSEQLKQAGMGDVGEKAKETLNTYKQAMTGLLAKATETAKKITGE